MQYEDYHRQFSAKGGKATQEKLRADPEKKQEQLKKMYEGRLKMSEEAKQQEREKRSKALKEYWRKVKKGEIKR